MMRRVGSFALLVLLILAAASASPGTERFPPPEFTSHTLPETVTWPPASWVYEYMDVAFLTVGLALATWFALVRRSRKALFVLTIVSLLWLGSWRQGCVCSIGSIQNIALAVTDPSYTVPFSVVVFFSLPILFALFFGRTFCAAVCPLGAVQELVAMKPVRVPSWIDQSLGLLPYVYLGAAVLFAATGTTFIICNYDPFVGFFRLSGPHEMLILGACFLVIGVFIGRPYCRYLCPYGAILGLCSKVAKRHVRIPPEECIKCRLCEDACPYGAIQEPTVEQTPQDRLRGRRHLAATLLLLPVLVFAGAWLGKGLAHPLALVNPTVRLAEYVRQSEQSLTEPAGADEIPEPVKHRNDAVEAFRNTGRPPKDLFQEARELRDRFGWYGAALGAWVGLVIGGKLIHLSVRRRRIDYQPEQANCVSCGRCFWYCPHEQLRLGLIETLPVVAPPSIPPAKSNGDAVSAAKATSA